jgi:hypothetical protein
VYRVSVLVLSLLILFSCATENGKTFPGKRAGDPNPSEATLSGGKSESKENGSSGGSAQTIEIVNRSLIWLEKARIAWFVEEDREETIACLDRIIGDDLTDEGSRTLYRLLCRKVYTGIIPLEGQGFPDTNISALYIDRDDLWLGTWTGGIARYSLPLGDLSVLRESRDSLRVEKISGFEGIAQEIRIAGYSDLYGYDKKTSRFTRTTPEDMGRINSLVYFQNRLYASTVNRGLWVEKEGYGWTRIGESMRNLDRINRLVSGSGGKRLLIATAADGVLAYDGNFFTNWREEFGDFRGRNITAIAERENYILAGTYGEGVYLLDRKNGTVRHFTKKRGDLLSDYVLTVSLDGSYALVGTLGGGVSAWDRNRLDSNIRWISLGLEEGLNSLDVTDIAVYNNSLYIAVLGQGILIVNEDIIEKKL